MPSGISEGPFGAAMRPPFITDARMELLTPSNRRLPDVVALLGFLSAVSCKQVKPPSVNKVRSETEVPLEKLGHLENTLISAHAENGNIISLLRYLSRVYDPMSRLT